MNFFFFIHFISLIIYASSQIVKLHLVMCYKQIVFETY
jgi:hypothetical protein